MRLIDPPEVLQREQFDNIINQHYPDGGKVATREVPGCYFTVRLLSPYPQLVNRARTLHLDHQTIVLLRVIDLHRHQLCQ